MGVCVGCGGVCRVWGGVCCESVASRSVNPTKYLALVPPLPDAICFNRSLLVGTAAAGEGPPPRSPAGIFRVGLISESALQGLQLKGGDGGWCAPLEGGKGVGGGGEAVGGCVWGA